MNIKLLKYWRIELFDGPTASSVSSLCKGVARFPFFTGYAKEPLNLRKIQDDKYLTLFCEPDSADTHSFLADRVYEIKCLPVYENEATFLKEDAEEETEDKADSAAVESTYDYDSFRSASRPLVKWLNDNAHYHASVIVELGGAKLYTCEIYAKKD